jgi:hypothetical protein
MFLTCTPQHTAPFVAVLYNSHIIGGTMTSARGVDLRRLSLSDIRTDLGSGPVAISFLIHTRPIYADIDWLGWGRAAWTDDTAFSFVFGKKPGLAWSSGMRTKWSAIQTFDLFHLFTSGREKRRRDIVDSGRSESGVFHPSLILSRV